MGFVPGSEANKRGFCVSLGSYVGDLQPAICSKTSRYLRSSWMHSVTSRLSCGCHGDSLAAATVIASIILNVFPHSLLKIFR